MATPSLRHGNRARAGRRANQRRRFGYYRISKDGMEVLRALRILDAKDREGLGGLEDPAQR